ncbi:GH3 auxin-responsive promoter family protein [Lacipirellula sp.]|uniref:GH3 auxin-responsive promoter family protein n=1 Tax=Lacipirellula sp. TaxID=2691419 RepID=UPI003D0F1A99
MFGPSFCNTVWMAACFREAQAFRRSTGSVQQTQARLLRRIVQDNRQTWFGEQHRFSTISSVKEFQDAVPISSFDDYRDSVERIARGDSRVLTAERVDLLEPTGGTSHGEKLIPYTASLRQAFQRAIKVWIWDLYSARPALRRGTAYWSISPLGSLPRRTSGGIPIGFDEDAAYLSSFEKMLVERTLAVPSSVALAPDVASCRFATLFFLLRDTRLSLLSVWSPTYLTELLKFLWSNRDELCRDVERGRISSPASSQQGSLWDRAFEPRPQRADELRELFGDGRNIADSIRTIWPELGLVSCWADGPSSTYVNNLRTYLDGVELQPKGLLATEAFVSVPIVSQAAPSLAIRSHFFEFRPSSPSPHSSSEVVVLAHELEEGCHYEVLITTQGGLYRYQLHDQIEVVGFSRETPMVRFVGKTDATSDLVGEKLNAAHVETVLQSTFRELGISPQFAQLNADKVHSRYTLRLCDPTIRDGPQLIPRLCTSIDIGLSANPAYQYARSLSQLHAPCVEMVDEPEVDASVTLQLTSKLAAGQRLGDIKASTFGLQEQA